MQVLSSLQHPHITQFLQSFECNSELVIAMEYCSGGDLRQLIAQRRGILFPQDRILDWFVQLCLAVKYIHDKRILHRDIKAQNIFLTEGGKIKLGDFGISKVLDHTKDLANTCIGTPYYLSPEMCQSKPYNSKSDVWALGCVLYEMAALKHPFEATCMKGLVMQILKGSFRPVPAKFTWDFKALIRQILQGDPQNRPSVTTILAKKILLERVPKFIGGISGNEDLMVALRERKDAELLSKKKHLSASTITGPAAKYGYPLRSRRTSRKKCSPKKRTSLSHKEPANNRMKKDYLHVKEVIPTMVAGNILRMSPSISSENEKERNSSNKLSVLANNISNKLKTNVSFPRQRTKSSDSIILKKTMLLTPELDKVLLNINKGKYFMKKSPTSKCMERTKTFIRTRFRSGTQKSKYSVCPSQMSCGKSVDSLLNENFQVDSRSCFSDETYTPDFIQDVDSYTDSRDNVVDDFYVDNKIVKDVAPDICSLKQNNLPKICRGKLFSQDLSPVKSPTHKNVSQSILQRSASMTNLLDEINITTLLLPPEFRSQGKLRHEEDKQLNTVDNFKTPTILKNTLACSNNVMTSSTPVRRLRWGAGDPAMLAQAPLETTRSQMDATTDADKVILHVKKETLNNVFGGSTADKIEHVGRSYNNMNEYHLESAADLAVASDSCQRSSKERRQWSQASSNDIVDVLRNAAILEVTSTSTLLNSLVSEYDTPLRPRLSRSILKKNLNILDKRFNAAYKKETVHDNFEMLSKSSDTKDKAKITALPLSKTRVLLSKDCNIKEVVQNVTQINFHTTADETFTVETDQSIKLGDTYVLGNDKSTNNNLCPSVQDRQASSSVKHCTMNQMKEVNKSATKLGITRLLRKMSSNKAATEQAAASVSKICSHETNKLNGNEVLKTKTLQQPISKTCELDAEDATERVEENDMKENQTIFINNPTCDTSLPNINDHANMNISKTYKNQNINTRENTLILPMKNQSFIPNVVMSEGEVEANNEKTLNSTSVCSCSIEEVDQSCQKHGQLSGVTNTSEQCSVNYASESGYCTNATNLCKIAHLISIEGKGDHFPSSCESIELNDNCSPSSSVCEDNVLVVRPPANTSEKQCGSPIIVTSAAGVGSVSMIPASCTPTTEKHRQCQNRVADIRTIAQLVVENIFQNTKKLLPITSNACPEAAREISSADDTLTESTFKGIVQMSFDKSKLSIESNLIDDCCDAATDHCRLDIGACQGNTEEFTIDDNLIQDFVVETPSDPEIVDHLVSCLFSTLGGACNRSSTVNKVVKSYNVPVTRVIDTPPCSLGSTNNISLDQNSFRSLPGLKSTNDSLHRENHEIKNIRSVRSMENVNKNLADTDRHSVVSQNPPTLRQLQTLDCSVSHEYLCSADTNTYERTDILKVDPTIFRKEILTNISEDDIDIPIIDTPYNCDENGLSFTGKGESLELPQQKYFVSELCEFYGNDPLVRSNLDAGLNCMQEDDTHCSRIYCTDSADKNIVEKYFLKDNEKYLASGTTKAEKQSCVNKPISNNNYSSLNDNFFKTNRNVLSSSNYALGTQLSCLLTTEVSVCSFDKATRASSLNCNRSLSTCIHDLAIIASEQADVDAQDRKASSQRELSPTDTKLSASDRDKTSSIIYPTVSTSFLPPNCNFEATIGTATIDIEKGTSLKGKKQISSANVAYPNPVHNDIFGWIEEQKLELEEQLGLDSFIKCKYLVVEETCMKDTFVCILRSL